jgi:hypothetical protein
LAQKIKDRDVLRLAGTIIDHSPPPEEPSALFPGDDLFTLSQRRRGLPIGNQTSQFFANVYLDPLDHFVKERLRLPGYARYVDDFVAFADDKAVLREARAAVIDFLAALRLRLHPTKYNIRRLYDLLEALIQARYTRQRRELLHRANVHLELLRYQVRLAHDVHCLKTSSYEHASRELHGIGTMVGAWMNSAPSN